MLFYAMVVVVVAHDEESAHRSVSGYTAGAPDLQFVGDPWPVVPTVDDDGFTTPDAISQRREPISDTCPDGHTDYTQTSSGGWMWRRCNVCGVRWS